jgi:CelD/BcsL family acetyltransferase involved in cellulose biosynthesis
MISTITIDGRAISVALHQSLEDLAQLQDTWRELLSTSSSDGAFVSWHWMYTWAEHFIKGERRLFVLVVSEGSHVIGIAPWYIDRASTGPVRIREIRFLGVPEGGSDYLDVIARKRKERIVAEALLATLTGTLASSWDVLALKEIPSDSQFLTHFIAQLRRNGKHYSIEEGSFCPGIQLPSSFDAYLGQLSAHCRQSFRRKMRRLRANDGVEHVVVKSKAADRFVEFRDLHERRWGQPMNGLFELVSSYAARTAGRDAWQPELSLLSVNGRTIAGLVHLTKGRRIFHYLMAVDRTFNKQLSVGTLMCGINIETAIEGGFLEYDFLKGEEAYKLRFMNRARRSINISVPNRTLRSMSAWTFGAVTALGKMVLR